MNHECNDIKMGNMLHAYELGILSPADMEKFEIHLIKCEYCFSELKKNNETVETLLHDEEIKALAETGAVDKSFGERIKRYFLPEMPIVFRPVVTWVLIILMIYPAVIGLRALFEDKAVPVQTISLIASRSLNGNVFKLTKAEDIVLMFVYSKAEASKSYKVAITNESGKVIYGNDRFEGFDGSKTGNLLLTSDRFPEGQYKLTVVSFDGDKNNIQEYQFKIIYQ